MLEPEKTLRSEGAGLVSSHEHRGLVLLPQRAVWRAADAHAVRRRRASWQGGDISRARPAGAEGNDARQSRPARRADRSTSIPPGSFSWAICFTRGRRMRRGWRPPFSIGAGVTPRCASRSCAAIMIGAQAIRRNSSGSSLSTSPTTQKGSSHVTTRLRPTNAKGRGRPFLRGIFTHVSG